MQFCIMDFLGLDNQYIWHPFTQVKNSSLPVNIIRGEGAWLIAGNQERYLDGTASWWVNAHGHAHPYIAKKIYEQAVNLEHVIFAGFTHPPAIELAVRLISLLPGKQQRIFYSDNGSTSVEVALKMAIQYFYNLGKKKHRIIAFRNSYHGDTLGAMSAAERNAFNLPFEPFLFEVEFIPAPEKGMEAASLKSMVDLFSACDDVAAFIFEPLVQGASGMRMHDANTLSDLIGLCRQKGVITIADEVFTGFFRTGKMFASEYPENKPDIICLSKALTGGFLPLGVTAVPEFIFQAFASDDNRKTFFHGHSYTANPIACSAALASLDLFQQNECIDRIKMISEANIRFAEEIRDHPLISEIRVLGTIIALNIRTSWEEGYLNPVAGEITQWFLRRNIYLRPLGNVIYCTPPYCISQEELNIIFDGIRDFLNEK